MRKFKLGVLALGAALAVGVGAGIALRSNKAVSVSAGDSIQYSMVPNQETTGSSSTTYITSAYSFTYQGVDWTMNQWNPKTLQFKTNQATATNEFNFFTGVFPGNITSVVISVSALTVKTETGFMLKGQTTAFTAAQSTGGSSMTWDEDAKTLSWTTDSSNGYKAIAFYQNGKVASGTNYLADADAIVVTYESSSGPVKELTSLAVSGSMTKTTYTTAESWDPTGLTVTGTYDNDPTDTADVTSSVTWTYNPTKPATSVSSVVATASIGELSADSAAQAVTVTAVPGTEEQPYTVAQARAAIDAGSGITDVYATGIVVAIPYAYTSNNGITFNFADTAGDTTTFLQAYKCKATDGPALTDIEIGDTVVVRGTLTKYNTTYEFTNTCTLVSDTKPQVTKYDVISRIDNGSLSVEKVVEGSTLEVSVVPNIGYWYPETLDFVRVAGVDVQYTYEGGVVTVENVTGNVTIQGTCVASNPIKSLYGQMNNAALSGDFYGYYVGLSVGNGPIVMDGEYGIMLYNTSADVSGWTEGETILHVTAGTISIYNGLYEIKNYTAVVAESAEIAKPVIHTTTGAENAMEANRLTNATGYVSAVTKGNLTDDAKTADIEFTFVVGSAPLKVFYKKAAQEADVITVLADSLANHTEITLKGFTAWYKGIQLTLTGIVEAVDTYTAELFAQDLLAQTNAVCDGYQEGDDNHDALVLIWSDLASNDKYPSLPADQKTILAEAERNESGTDIEKAMARYDFLTGKYNLNNFINGRTPIVTSSIYHNPAASNANVNMLAIIIIASVALVTTTGAITAIIIKKRVSR